MTLIINKKPEYTVRDRATGNDVNGTNANVAFTSEPIQFNQNCVWNLNVWFTSLAVTGKDPTFTIQVSDTTDVDSFNDLTNAVDIIAPHMVTKKDSPWLYFRIIYDPQGATGGTKNFDLIILQCT
jgi:hypothetical protein